jgi:misacylated tRNA(Ala) deacylase
MTTLHCLTDSYLRRCEARVEAVEPDGVVVDETVVYPGGGGQPADRGWLTTAGGARLEIAGVRRGEGRVVHLCDPGALSAGGLSAGGLSTGDAVTLEVDWERRYPIMRTHTALHILCGVIWRDYQAQVTGGNIEPGKGRLDFEFERLERDLVGEIEERINREVVAAREVRVKVLPREEAFQIPDLIRTKINLLPPGITEVRTVEIVGLDLQADGGTHVANTRDVGPIRIADYKSKGRINKRIAIALEP